MFCTNVKIGSVNIKNRVYFGAALNTKERKDYEDVLCQGKKVLGVKQSALIVNDPCLPQKSSLRTGVGNLSSDISSQFFDFMKSYIGIDTVEVLPQGEMHPPRHEGFYCPYGGSAMSLGEHLINLELLTGEDFGSILTTEDIKKVAEANKSPASATIANFENILGKESAQNRVLKGAFENFKGLGAAHPLAQEYGDFKKENFDALEITPLYEALKKENNTTDRGRWACTRWDDVDRRLLVDDTEDTRKRLAFLREKYADDIEFYTFKQFLAEKSLSYGKEKLNKKGLKLVGDCPLGYSAAEVWANQNAFMPDGFYGWGIPALDYSKMFKPDGSLDESGKFIEKKFAYAFKHYDGLRVDVSWGYIKPHIKRNGSEILATDMQGRILKLIEDTAKRVKGEDFDLKDIWHEIEADEDIFTPFLWGSKTPKPIPALENRCKIFTTAYSNPNWGTVDFLENTANLEDDEFIIGAGNHDSDPLRHLARNANGRKPAQIEPLGEYMKIPEEKLEDPIEFVKAKFGEIFTAKKQMYFYMDVFGRDEIFNASGSNDTNFFRYLIPEDFERAYHRAVQEGWGLNAMDALRKAFVAKGLDKENKELYDNISHYADKLSEKGALSEEEANALLIKKPQTDEEKKKKHPGFMALAIGATIVALIVVADFIIGKIKAKRQEKSQNT